MTRRALSLACLLALIGGAAVRSRAAQQSQPTFRSAADLVEIDAVVTDRSGAIVRGLTRDDFQITENGQPQVLQLFSFVDIPVPPAAGVTAVPTVEPDVSTNAPVPDSRLYVIVLDGFHVDPTRSTVVRKQARQFIEDGLGPHDLAAVMLLGHGVVNQQFTSNKLLLLAAVDQFIGQKSQSATMNIYRDGFDAPPDQVAEDSESGARASETRIMLASLAQVCERLGESQGHRRAVVLFGEGLDFDTSDLIGARPGGGLKYEPAKHANDVLQAEHDLFVAAKRANVAIYTVDPRGSTIGEDLQMQVQSSAPLGTSIQTEVQRSQGTLRTFADVTGGLAVVNTNNIATGFAHIVQANSSYYVLGYSPINALHDGTYRKLAVTAQRPDVDVTARKGYFAPAPEATSTASPPKAAGPNAVSPRMRELLASALPVSGLGLRVTGGPVRKESDKVLVALIVEIDTTALLFAEQSGVLSNDIEMAFQAMDSAGKLQAANRSVGNLRLQPAQRAAVANGLRYVVEFPVSPGRYQVRVAAHESVGDAGGSALLDVEALDFAKAPLAMGTIFLTTSTAQGMPTTGSYPLLKGILPAPPTTTREFTSHDTLVAFVNVNDSDTGRSHTVAITTTVQDSTGREVFRRDVTKESADLAPKKNGYGLVSEIPLSNMPPGRYLLTTDAKTATGKTATKSLVFLVR